MCKLLNGQDWKILKIFIFRIVLTLTIFHSNNGLIDAAVSDLNEKQLHELNTNRFYDEIGKIAVVGLPPALIALAGEERRHYEIIQNCTKQIQLADEEEKNQYFISLIEAYSHDYDESMKKISIKSADPEERDVALSHNPLSTILMFRRFAKWLTPLQLGSIVDGQIVKFPCEQYQDHVEEIRDTFHWPSTAAYNEAANRLFRIQQTYNFPPKDIATGKLGTVETNVSLPLDVCYDLGLIALNYSYYTLSIEWLKYVETQLSTPETKLRFPYLTPSKVQRQIRRVIHKHDEEWMPPDFRALSTNQYFFHTRIRDGEIDPATNELIFPLPVRLSLYNSSNLERENDEFGNVPQYWALCSGDYHQPLKIRSKLFCWRETKIHPTYTIGPLKVEFISRSPYPDIIQVYDLINDRLIKSLREMSITALAASTLSLESVEYKVNGALSERSSFDTRLGDKTHKDAGEVTAILKRAMGIQIGVDGAEPMQMIMYGFGGHIRFHPDVWGEVSDTISSHWPRTRFATAMLYFSDVEAGGHTIYFGVGVAVPAKGSATLWWNVRSDVTLDFDVFHAGCPVIMGEKFGANKWISSADQMFTRGCPLEEKQKLRWAVNGQVDGLGGWSAMS